MRRRWSLSGAAALGWAALALLFPADCAGALAAEPAWPSAPYTYVVVDQDLRTVLQEFGTNLGLRVAVSDAVQGRVRGRLPALPPRQFLDHLAQVYGLDWYYDGLVLSVSAASEATTRLLPLQGIALGELESGLRSADVLDPRFPIRPGPTPGLVQASGPPRYLDLVQRSLAAMVADRPPPASPAKAEPAPLTKIVIYRGASASAVEVP